MQSVLLVSNSRHNCKQTVHVNGRAKAIADHLTISDAMQIKEVRQSGATQIENARRLSDVNGHHHRDVNRLEKNSGVKSSIVCRVDVAEAKSINILKQFTELYDNL